MPKLLISCILLTGSTLAAAMQAELVDTAAAGGVQAPEVTALETHQGGGLTLDQAVEQVRRQYNGRIVSAETRVSGGRETHIIKVLTSDGKVKTVRVPGRRV
jgi:uncharacterized membrane protein YkoI